MQLEWGVEHMAAGGVGQSSPQSMVSPVHSALHLDITLNILACAGVCKVDS
jgi:hypothetical protein